MKTDKLNIVIISGGTGATELIHGFKNIDKTKNAIRITNIINPYDDGASCGIVREQLNVIGPGDLRKNQWNQHKFNNKHPNIAIKEFCNNRYDLPKGKECEFVCDLLDRWDFAGKEYLKSYVKLYFELQNYDGEYNSFNVSNIVYGAMIKSKGAEETFNYFQHMFGNTDRVVLNSLDNMKLMGRTSSGKYLKNETPDIIFHNDSNDPINHIFFIDFSQYLQDKHESKLDDKYLDDLFPQQFSVSPKLNPTARRAIVEADLIIFSPGTQWSSLIPTYATDGFSECILQSSAKKILIMNNIEDTDTLGQSNLDILKSINQYLTLDNIDIFINKSVDTILSKHIGYKFNNANIFYKELGFINNKFHDPYKTAVEVLEHYYNINNPDIIFFDFDDTIYSRYSEHNSISDINVELLNKLSKYVKCAVISGNDYSTIHSKLVNMYGSSIDVNFDIWADSGVVNYKHGNKISDKKEFILDNPSKVYDLLIDIGIPKRMVSIRGDWPTADIKKSTCISIKPLDILQKNMILYILNNFFETEKLNNIAMKMGRTSVDILNINTNKSVVLDFDEYKNIDKNKMLYIGDEVYDGNDYDISIACGYHHNVKSPYETNILLNLILEKYNDK